MHLLEPPPERVKRTGFSCPQRPMNNDQLRGKRIEEVLLHLIKPRFSPNDMSHIR